MKYAVTLTRSGGKSVTLCANEWIDIDIKSGNTIIKQFTVRDGTVYDENDNDVETK